MNAMIIFDDGHGQLGPMTDLRAAFEVRTGMFTTAGRLAAHRPKSLAGYWVLPHIKDLVAERANAPVNELPDEEIVFCVNARWGMPDSSLKLEVGEAMVEQDSSHVVAARLRHADAEYFLQTGQLHERTSVREHDQRLLYRYPWDVIALMKETIPHDIVSTRILEAKIIADEAAVVGDHPVVVDRTVAVYPHVVFDAGQGPIIVHERSVIRPGAVICGPCSIGPQATVMDRALIKPHTVISQCCKVGGEVGATIFQGYANKAHDGHLGDSWVGKWVNFGAGTSNSNLLNTYGEVAMRVEPGEPVHRTGLTFLGAIVGDHVKFAINTSIMTGTVVGTGAMIASSTPPPTTVRRFAWLTDQQQRSYRYEKFVDSTRMMMSRRGKRPSDAYLELLSDLHALTMAELKKA